MSDRDNAKMTTTAPNPIVREPATAVASDHKPATSAQRLQGRMSAAQKRYREQIHETLTAACASPGAALGVLPSWTDWSRYSVDYAQRWVLYWDTLRQRGNNFIEHERAGMPPVLFFDSEMVMDGRGFERPVNYALLRILAPKGGDLQQRKRPYVIIDPRAGHGPGIGGFKDDSQAGVALRAGHPVYFVVFYPAPEPNQTLLDVCTAEALFVRRVRELHPDVAKPVIVGNCQGGWAAMLLAASSPEDTGPIVINGAPMSYWGGAGREGDGDNPMRYAGGLAGGTWLASFAADIGNGRFDGAHLVKNFEALDPASSQWGKFRHLFSNIDTETERFLEFERWWGGYFLMNREEIDWITQNLFVGNKLSTGDLKSNTERMFDLRNIRSPIILFASLGDNITPPQQAFNWVGDVYGSTEEVKARGQVIVGLLHKDIGHLGIFVAGHVAKKEHTQIVSVLESIEALSPGIYGMEIIEDEGVDEGVSYSVRFVETRLEDVLARLNREERVDEQPFEAVARVSELNQRAYELVAQPVVQAMSNEVTAHVSRQMHPLRRSRWSISDRNPCLQWLAPAAEAVKSARAPLAANAPLRRAEHAASDLVHATLDYCRDLRDACSEAAFTKIYGTLQAFHPKAASVPAEKGRRWRDRPTDEDPLVTAALETIAEGGFVEAVGRMSVLLRTVGAAVPLSRIEARQAFRAANLKLLPDIEPAEMRRIEGTQELIVKKAPERALALLPALLQDASDRERFVKLLLRAAEFQDKQGGWLTSEQRELLDRVRDTLMKPMPWIRPRS